MESEQGGSEVRATDGRRVVGADDQAPDAPRPRRDQPVPPSWAHDVEPHFVPEDYAARPVPARVTSTPTLVVIALLVLFLVGMLVDFWITVAQEGASARLALGFMYGVVIQFFGWWTVIHLWQRR